MHTHTHTQMHTVIMRTHLIHTSHPSPHTHPLLLTHSCTHREAAYALSFSLCLEGEGNCCGSQATERQPSVWLIGISGQKSVVYTVQRTTLDNFKAQKALPFSTPILSVLLLPVLSKIPIDLLVIYGKCDSSGSQAFQGMVFLEGRRCVFDQ